MIFFDPNQFKSTLSAPWQKLINYAHAQTTRLGSQLKMNKHSFYLLEFFPVTFLAPRIYLGNNFLCHHQTKNKISKTTFRHIVNPLYKIFSSYNPINNYFFKICQNRFFWILIDFSKIKLHEF